MVFLLNRDEKIDNFKQLIVQCQKIGSELYSKGLLKPYNPKIMNKKVICDTKVINKKPEIITTIEKNRIEKEFKKMLMQGLKEMRDIRAGKMKAGVTS